MGKQRRKTREDILKKEGRISTPKTEANALGVDVPKETVDFIDYLNEKFPEKTPEKDWDDRKIWMYAGVRTLINQLRRVQSKVNEGVQIRRIDL